MRILCSGRFFRHCGALLPALALMVAAAPPAYPQESGQSLKPVTQAPLTLRQEVAKRQNPANHSELQSISRAFLYSASGLDIGTTLYGLKEGRREANPMLGQQRGGIAAMVIGTTVAMDFAATKLARSGHPKLAAFSRLLGGTLHLGAAMKNLR